MWECIGLPIRMHIISHHAQNQWIDSPGSVEKLQEEVSLSLIVVLVLQRVPPFIIVGLRAGSS